MRTSGYPQKTFIFSFTRLSMQKSWTTHSNHANHVSYQGHLVANHSSTCKLHFLIEFIALNFQGMNEISHLIKVITGKARRKILIKFTMANISNEWVYSATGKCYQKNETLSLFILHRNKGEKKFA